MVPNGDPPTVTDGAITDAGAPHGSDPVGTDNGAAAQNLDGVQARYRDVFERIKPFLATGDKAAKVEIKKTLGAYREAVLRRDVAAATAVLDALERQATPEPEPNVQDSGQASSPASPIRQIVSDAERRGKVVTKTPPHNQEGNALYYEAIEPVELHVRIRARAETEAEPVE